VPVGVAFTFTIYQFLFQWGGKMTLTLDSSIMNADNKRLFTRRLHRKLGMIHI